MRARRLGGPASRVALAVALAFVGAIPGCRAPFERHGADATNTLRWSAGHEERVFGFLVYRSTSRDGPFVRVNPAIVRVPDDGGATHEYSWVDRDVEAGKAYFYYLDVLSDAGIKSRFSGILSRTPPG